MRVPFAVLLAATLAGCALPVHPNAGEPAGGRPALTRAAAEAAVARYLSASRRFTSRDGKALASAETEGRYAIDDAIRRMALFSDPQNRQRPAPPLKIANPTYFLPRLAGYPKWFVVSATTTTKGTGRQSLLMVFEQDRAGNPWRLSSSVLLQKGARVPPIATDRQGNAISVSPDEAGLALAPKDVARAHSSYLSAGLKGAQANKFAADESARTLMKANTADQKAFTLGTVSHTFDSADFPLVALRTRQGGALVFYGARRHSNFLLTYPGARIDTRLWHALGVPDPVFHQLSLVELLQFATVIPPRGGGEVEPIASATGLVDASGQ